MKELFAAVKEKTDIAIQLGLMTEQDRNYLLAEIASQDELTRELWYTTLLTIFEAGVEYGMHWCKGR